MLNAGDQAPEFVLPDADMTMTDSSEHLGSKPHVVYFIPRTTPLAVRGGWRGGSKDRVDDE